MKRIRVNMHVVHCTYRDRSQQNWYKMTLYLTVWPLQPKGLFANVCSHYPPAMPFLYIRSPEGSMRLIHIVFNTDYGHPERAFFLKFQTFGLGQTFWADILWHLGYFRPNYQHYFGTVSLLSLEKCIWWFFLQKLWFSGLTHINPKKLPNMILAVRHKLKNMQKMHFLCL